MSKSKDTKQTRAITSRTGAFRRIVEINAPIRFYWHWDGFDGIEVTIDSTRFSRYQQKLLYEVFDAVGGKIQESNDDTQVPQAFQNAFRRKRK